jgi:hypothetical protein
MFFTCSVNVQALHPAGFQITVVQISEPFLSQLFIIFVIGAGSLEKKEMENYSGLEGSGTTSLLACAQDRHTEIMYFAVWCICLH